jgi:hypothetical protein
MAEAPSIEVGQRLQPLPKQLLEQGLVGLGGPAEDDSRAVVEFFGLPVLVDKAIDEFQNGGVVFGASEVVNH